MRHSLFFSSLASSQEEQSTNLQDRRSTDPETDLYFWINISMHSCHMKVEQYVDLGTHGMIICSVTEARVMSDQDTMTYTYYQLNVKPKPETEGKKGFVCKCLRIHLRR